MKTRDKGGKSGEQEETGCQANKHSIIWNKESSLSTQN